ncbi:hypothetical protein ES703_120189 [subsurface metagenome]
MAKQCSMCFQFKDTLVPVVEKLPVLVCKACAFKANAVIGFLMFHKVDISYQPDVFETPQTPLEKESPEEKASKRKRAVKAVLTK